MTNFFSPQASHKNFAITSRPITITPNTHPNRNRHPRGKQIVRPPLSTIYRAARGIHLDLDVFFADLSAHKHEARVARDVVSADESGVTGTPAFFIDGKRYTGPYDPDSLTTQVHQALDAQEPAPTEAAATLRDPMSS
jgi:hypothetical protein